jgi:exosome complex component RRP41
MESRLHVEKLASVTELATDGCMKIHAILDAVIRENTEHLMSKLKA